ncbi:MAG TPA: ABC transporter permease subunit [Streptosporangiaceae bacterium]|nr:ABC transporter permease subunit [Streptosporangiaceae bacterium]
MTTFAWLLHAEWTKFRTVRGWVAAVLVAVLATIGLGLVSNSSCSTNGGGCPAAPAGPDGEAVQDAFSFAHQPLTGSGTITVRLTALSVRLPPGVALRSQSSPTLSSRQLPWSKAGIIIKANTAQGSAYAAMMVTSGHGVRMQWDFTHDAPGLAGAATGSSPRWLRLARTGDTITGYDSADGATWYRIGAVTLPRLPLTVQAGLFAASPFYMHIISAGIGGESTDTMPTEATGSFDHIGLSWSGSTWTSDQVGGQGPFGPGTAGAVRLTGSAGTVTGSGDIAPVIANPDSADGGIGIKDTLVGTFAGMLVLIVLAAMFITAEYRRGLIRLTLAASTSRVRALAAKAAVVGAIGFVAGAVAIAIAIPAGISKLHANGNPVLPVPALTEVRLVIGSGLLIGVAAVLALGIGTAVRRSAVAVAAVIAIVFVPYLIATVPGLLPFAAQNWLLRVTPAAGFAVQQAYPRYYQVDAMYRAVDGYYPLAPWAGLAVECAWAVAALLLAGYLLRRRDV